MNLHLGDIPAGATLYIPFATYNAAGASVTLSDFLVTDIKIYKNGSVVQRNSENGYALLDTDGIDFDGITGLHGFSIDLSDNSDSGFYDAGSFYWVVVSAVTIDGQSVSFIAATFKIIASDISTQLTAIKNKTDNLPSDPADHSIIIDATNTIITAIDALPTNSELNTALAAADDAVLAALAALPSAAQNANAVLTTQMSESYAVDGSAPTLAQALFGMQQFLMERSISGVTLTTKKIDGLTTAMQFTLDSASEPTSITRAS